MPRSIPARKASLAAVVAACFAPVAAAPLPAGQVPEDRLRGSGGEGNVVKCGTYSVTIASGGRTLAPHPVIERVGAIANPNPGPS